jgi:rubrerythrin
MKRQALIRFSSREEFLAHAHALEQELAERYGEMADSMQVHNNPAVAQLFRELADRGEEHAAELIGRAQGMDLPQIPPWEYQWLGLDMPGPEDCMQQLHYQMTSSQALQLALRIEQCAGTFYQRSLQDSTDAEIKGLAREMLGSKQKHLRLLLDWQSREAAVQVEAQEDLDPPHMPE